MQLKERKDNIQVYGCYQVGFNFMLKPDGVVTLEQMQALIIKMMKAACDVIEEENQCHTCSDTEKPEGTILSSEPQEKKSPILPQSQAL